MAKARKKKTSEKIWPTRELRREVSRLVRQFLNGRAAPARVKRRVEEGATFEHVARDGRVVRVTYRGGEWRFRGRAYTSISAAANAAAEHLGQRSRTINGWVFWGLERRGRAVLAAEAASDVSRAVH